MKDLIGCCGVNCSKCDAYIATRTNDDAKREKVAREWTEKHGSLFTAAQINCDGCQSNGRAPDWVTMMCPIHRCCREKAINTCAECDQYPCNELDELFPKKTKQRKNLETLWRKIN